MNSLMQDAFSLMLIGMGFVFVFLILLVFAMSAMSSLINKYFPEPEPVVPVAPPAAAPQQVIGEDIKTVVSLAVAKYREKHRK